MSSTQIVLPSSGGSDSTIRGKYVRTTRFALINSGTSGTVTPPASATIILDDFGLEASGLVDAVISQVQSSRPTFQAAVTVSGATITTTFDSSGNWVLSAAPDAYPVAIIYRVEQTLEDFDSDSSDIVGTPLVLEGTQAVRATALVVETDFYNVSVPFAQGLQGNAISGGSTQGTNGTLHHPGILELRDSTTANGGYRVLSSQSAIEINGGEKFVVTMYSADTRTTATSYIGIHDSISQADPVDGCYFKMVPNGTSLDITGTNSNNSTRSTTSTYSLALSTWATLSVEINSAATSVNFKIALDDGTVVFNENLTTNIPGSGRYMGFGITSTESTTDPAGSLCFLDYLRFEIRRVLTR